jgi:hypothetical protein
MTKPTKIIIDCQTNESIELELTDEEIAQMEADKLDAEARRDAQKASDLAKAEAKASALAKLAALGLTEDEAKAIAG